MTPQQACRVLERALPDVDITDESEEAEALRTLWELAVRGNID